MKKPNLFMVGAPKCGTTSLAKWMGEHPEAFLSEIKEPYYFADDLNIGRIKSEKDYNSLYEKARNIHRVVFEASTGYLYSKNAINNILKYCDDKPKFLMVFRNPIEMVYSLHSQLYYMGWEDIGDFETAWFMQEKRAYGEMIPKSCNEKKVLLYKEWCLLGQQLERFIKNSAGCDYYIIWLEDIAFDSKTEFLKLIDFLGIDKRFLPSFKVHNQNKGYRSRHVQLFFDVAYKYKYKLGIKKEFGLSRFNSKKKKRKDMSEEIKKRLIKEFRDDVLLLQDITGRDLRKWLV